MSEKILIVEDDNDINNLLCEALTKAGYDCVQAYSGSEGLLQLRIDEFVLIILDLMLPGLTGEELLAKIKPQNTTPVIVLSAKDELDSKVDLLSAGAEDYITKPFQIKELIARAQVQIRRSSTSAENKFLSHKELILDRENFIVKVCNQEISLTRQEMKILEILLTNPSRVYSKQEIYNFAWDDYYIGEDKTINVHISNIRQKIKAITDEDYIDTVWGVGFRLSKC